MHWTAIFLIFSYILHGASAAPQFVSFKDGNVGVNFGGYHASAGLGGLLTGNTAQGGLSASAGTPWGQQAAAGLDGTLVNGRTSGAAYAGAQANSDVGASAVLGGTAGEKGFAGSESHVHGKTTSQTISGHHLTTVNEPHLHQQPPPPPSPTTPGVESDIYNNNNIAIQKIKPSKKKHHQHTFIKSQQPVAQDQLPVVHTKHIVKSVETSPPVKPAYDHPVNKEVNSSVHFNGNGVVQSALNIPIGILRSLQESLSGLRVDKTVSYSARAENN